MTQVAGHQSECDVRPLPGDQSSDAATRQALLDEYKECSQNLRHYSNMRFAELTLFCAINAGLFGAMFSQPPRLARYEQVGTALAGMFFATVFSIMNRRRVALWVGTFRRAVALESELGFSQYVTRPREGWLSNRNAAAALYVVFFGLWFFEFVVRAKG